MKKTVALLLTLVMAFSLASVALAADAVVISAPADKTVTVGDVEYIVKTTSNGLKAGVEGGELFGELAVAEKTVFIYNHSYLKGVLSHVPAGSAVIIIRCETPEGVAVVLDAAGKPFGFVAASNFTAYDLD